MQIRYVINFLRYFCFLECHPLLSANCVLIDSESSRAVSIPTYSVVDRIHSTPTRGRPTLRLRSQVMEIPPYMQKRWQEIATCIWYISPLLTHSPLSCQNSLTKYTFKFSKIKNFKAVIAEHEMKHGMTSQVAHP